MDLWLGFDLWEIFNVSFFFVDYCFFKIIFFNYDVIIVMEIILF